MGKGLGSISPKGPKEYNPNADSWVSQVYKQCLDSKFEVKHGRRPGRSPSSFPICSVIDWMKHYHGRKLGHYPGQMEARMEFYTRIGDVVHEVSQWFMGMSGVQYGHWKCVNKDCKHGRKAQDIVSADGQVIKAGKLTRQFTTKHTCPGCKMPMFHIEVEIRWGKKKNKGYKLGKKEDDNYFFRGFIDGIWKIPKEFGGGYWIIDYKTTSMAKLDRNEYPEKKHMYQLPIYAYILKKKYGLDIKGFSLIYVPRDNPNAFYEHREDWSGKWDKWSKKVIKENVNRQIAMDADLETGDYELSIEHKPCKSERDFHNKMSNGFDECPMLDVCFSPQLVRKKLDSWKKLCDNKKTIPTGLFKENIKVLTDSQRKGLGISTKSKKDAPQVKHVSM